MIDVLLKTKLYKYQENFSVNNLYAGIIFDELGNSVDKIVFEIIDDNAKDVFDDKVYSLNEEDDIFVGYVLSLEKLFKNHFRKNDINLWQLYLGYKMFINDDSYINRHLNYFGMMKRDVGYKGKKEIVRDSGSFNTSGQDLYYNLLHIINYKNVKYERNIENGKKR